MRTDEKPSTSILLSLFVVILLLLPVQYVKAAPLQPFGTLDDIVLEKLTGKERVLLVLSKQADVASEIQSDGSIQVRLNGVKLSDRLQRIIGEGTLSNVTRIRPVQVDADGKLCVVLHIDLKDRAPYSILPQGSNVVIEFTLISKPSIVETKLADISQAGAKTPTNDPEQTKVFSATEQEMQKTRGRFQDDRRMTIDFPDQDLKMIFRLLAEESGKNFALGDEIKGNITIHMRNSTWKEILDSILFIKNLEMHEQGNTIRVMTREAMAKYKTLVKAAAIASVQDDALGTAIIPIKYRKLKKGIMYEYRTVGSGQKQMQGVAPGLLTGGPESLVTSAAADIKETSRAKSATDEEFVELLWALMSEDQFGRRNGSISVDLDTNSLIIKASVTDMTKIRDMIDQLDRPLNQILIKVHIVETTKDTARSLGIQWGGVFGQKVGNQSLFVSPGGTAGSTVPPGSALSGSYSPAYGSTGVGGQGFGVNFPAAGLAGTASGTLGLIFGTIGGNILELQLSALATEGKIKILSSPSLLTLDNKKATTKNGEKIPYTQFDKYGNPSTTFEEAVMQLDFTPHVIDDTSLSLDMKVTKDEPSGRSINNYPIILKKFTETSLTANDGETIVISGLTKQSSNITEDGIPALMNVPILGWLFKNQSKGDKMEEVLIFITPYIIKAKTTTDIQDGTSQNAPKTSLKSEGK